MMRNWLLFTLITFTIAQPLWPSLPQAFSADIESNIWERRVTLNKREYFDNETKLARYEVNTADSYSITYVDFNKATQWVVVDDKTCVSGPIPPVDPIIGRGGVEDLVNIAVRYNVSYVGMDEVRGIPVDKYVTNLNAVSAGVTYPNGTVVGANATFVGVVNYYYTASSWGFRAFNVSRKLVRVSLNLNRTDASGNMTVFSHSYEFINFISKKPLPSTFWLPAVCLNPVQSVVDILTKPAGQGLAAGMFFFGAFIGAVVACLSIWGYCRRRQMQREKFQRSSMEMTRHDED